MEDIRNTKRLASIIKDVRVAILHTKSNGNGFSASGAHARPMYTQRIDEDRFDGELFFFTDAASRKVQDLQLDPQVVLTYSDYNRNRYAVVYGSATCEHSEAKVRALEPACEGLVAGGSWIAGPDVDPRGSYRRGVLGWTIQRLLRVATDEGCRYRKTHRRLRRSRNNQKHVTVSDEPNSLCRM